MSKKDSKLVLAIEKQILKIKNKNEWNKKYDILLLLKTWVVNEEKYKTLIKTNDEIEEIFKPFLIQHNKNEKSFIIGLYKRLQN